VLVFVAGRASVSVVVALGAISGGSWVALALGLAGASVFVATGSLVCVEGAVGMVCAQLESAQAAGLCTSADIEMRIAINMKIHIFTEFCIHVLLSFF
jgi:hypothetical protein